MKVILPGSFFYAFKNNFKQGTALWFGSLFLQLILTADFLIIWQMDLAFLGNILFVFLFIIEFFVISMSLYAYALIARYTLSLSAVIKNSFLLSFGRLPYSMLMILICLLPVILTCLNLYTLLAGILFYFTIGISLLCWLLPYLLYIFKIFNIFDIFSTNFNKLLLIFCFLFTFHRRPVIMR